MTGCKPRFSTVLHPGGNSLVERTNASLKKMLAHVSQKYPKQWHKLLPIVLWCMQESRNETLGVSPFMMVMGRNPANPLKILKDTWTGENQLPQTVGKSVSEYVVELQTQLEEIPDNADDLQYVLTVRCDMVAFCDPAVRRMYEDEKQFKINAISSG